MDVEAVFIGGCRDGERMRLPDDRDMVLATPHPPAITVQALRARMRRLLAQGPEPVTPTITVYRRTGIRDDGARVYRAERC